MMNATITAITVKGPVRRPLGYAVVDGRRRLPSSLLSVPSRGMLDIEDETKRTQFFVARQLDDSILSPIAGSAQGFLMPFPDVLVRHIVLLRTL
jgi:hypothetical protein